MRALNYIHMSAQSCLTLCKPKDCSPLGSSVHGIFQAIILEWVAISSSKRSSWPRDGPCISCIARQILYHCATWEAHGVNDKADQFTQRKAHLSCHDLTSMILYLAQPLAEWFQGSRKKRAGRCNGWDTFLAHLIHCFSELWALVSSLFNSIINCTAEKFSK